MPARRLDADARRGPTGTVENVALTVNGQVVLARAGEPLLVALLAAGHLVLSRSPRRDEPRGAFCYAGQCAECRVVVDGRPNTLACRTPARDGMVIESQRGWA